MPAEIPDAGDVKQPLPLRPPVELPYSPVNDARILGELDEPWRCEGTYEHVVHGEKIEERRCEDDAVWILHRVACCPDAQLWWLFCDTHWAACVRVNQPGRCVNCETVFRPVRVGVCHYEPLRRAS